MIAFQHIALKATQKPEQNLKFDAFERKKKTYYIFFKVIIFCLNSDYFLK